MNTDQIGMWAGQVWQALDAAQAVEIKQLKKMTKISKDKEIFAALGWLAREGKVMFTEDESGKSLFVSLV